MPKRLVTRDYRKVLSNLESILEVMSPNERQEFLFDLDTFLDIAVEEWYFSRKPDPRKDQPE